MEQNFKMYSGEMHYICSICKLIFKQYSQLEKHSGVHGSGKPYSCDVCTESFTVKYSLQEHMKLHKDRNQLQYHSDCNLCGQSIDSKNHVQKHGKYSDGKLLICKPKKLLACCACGKSFEGKYLLLQHMRTHTGEKPFMCSICLKRFTSNGNMLYHFKMTHGDEKLYACNVCKKTFSRKAYMLKHVKGHTRERLYVCEVCERTFKEQAKFKEHIKTHAGEWPFTCNICQKMFSKRSTVMYHIKTVHTGGKSFASSLCKKSFSGKGSMTNHIKRHKNESPFACKKCDKTFKKKSEFVKHMKSHAGEQPFAERAAEKIQDCRMSLTHSYLLEKQMEVYTGVNKMSHRGDDIVTASLPCSMCDSRQTEMCNVKMLVEGDVSLCENCQLGSISCILCDDIMDISFLRTHLGYHTGELDPY